MPRSSSRRPADNITSGLFSSVFTYVSRELKDFVNTAAGREDDQEDDGGSSEGEETSRDPDIASQARKRGDGKRRRATCRVDDSVGWDEADSLAETSLRGKSYRRASYTTGSEEEEENYNRRKAASSSKVRLSSRRQALPDEDEETPGNPEQPQSSPKRPPTLLVRQPSVSMPGSFFGRSPSMEPSSERNAEKQRVVRFAHDEVSPAIGRTPEQALSIKSTTRRPHSRDIEENSAASDDELLPATTPSRSKHGDQSNHVRRATTDKSQASPLVPRRFAPSPFIKGKERECVEESEEEFEPSEAEEVQELYRSPEQSFKTQIKEKERELHTVKQKEQARHYDAGDDDDERLRDKVKIRALEEEVKRLQEELAKRPTSTPTVLMPPPPPPPPPLPPNSITQPAQSSTPTLFSDIRASLKHAGTPKEKPINPAAYGGPSVRKGQPTINLGADKMAAFLKEMKTHRLRKVGNTPANTSELPIGRSQPAVRVREVGEVGNKSEFLPRSKGYIDVGNRSEIPLASLSFSRLTKRKLGEDAAEHGPTSKRRAIPSSSRSQSGPSKEDLVHVPSHKSNLSSALSRLRQSKRSATSSFSNTSSTSDSSSRSRFSTATRSTGLTTPSLCSDNEQDNVSLEERLPPTPPHSASARSGSRSISVDDSAEQIEQAQAGEDISEVQDVFLDNDSVRQDQSNVFSGMYGNSRSGGLFSQKIHHSTKLLDSPRRPRPPARPKMGANASLTISQEGPLGDRDEAGGDERLPSYSSAPSNSPSQPQDKIAQSQDEVDTWRAVTNRAPSPALQLPMRPPPGTFKMKPTRTIRQKSSRLPVRSTSLATKRIGKIPVPTMAASGRSDTLDSELRRADESFGSDDVYEEQDGSVFSAVGSKSRKQGFLAHGGAGGLPIMMGPGYVEGLDDHADSEEDLPVSHIPTRGRKAVVNRRS